MDNIIILVIDKLAYQHIDLEKNSFGINPNLTRFAQEGTNFTNVFSHGCPTMIAIPSFYSSTLPLDFSGFDNGICDRPESFMGALRSAGYKTAIFSAQPLLERHGFGKGVDEFYELFHVDAIWNQLNFYTKYYIKRDKISFPTKRFEEDLRTAVNKFFGMILDFCQLKLQQERFIPNHKIYQYPFAKIVEKMQCEINQLESSPVEYLNQNTERMWKSSLETYLGIKKFAFYGLFSPEFLKRPHYNNNRFKLQLWERYMSTPDVFESVTHWMKKQQSKQKQAVLIHVSDISGLSFKDRRVLINWDRRLLKKYPERYKDNTGKYFYDLCVQYVDQCLGEFREKLEKERLLDDTHVFITADHGGIPEGPNSPFKFPETPSAGFKDDYVHVPMIYWNKKSVAKTNKKLFGQIDFGPTLCELAKMNKPVNFQGTSFFSETFTNDHIIFEHTHRGPCDINHKPIYLCLRTDQFKYIWKEAIYSDDATSKTLEEFYDLKKYPEENQNLIDRKEYQEPIKTLRTKAIQRFEILNRSRQNPKNRQ